MDKIKIEIGTDNGSGPNIIGQLCIADEGSIDWELLEGLLEWDYVAIDSVVENKPSQEYYIKCDEIIEQGLCTEDELSIAVRFGGASMETLEKLIECKNELQAEFAL
tara:strand:+ start:832 stop:1152 length:321 start_codon:yes stop_codon:yes gene_type:complete